MIYDPSKPRPYKRRGKIQVGRWEIDLRGILDNGLEVKRERRVFPANPNAGKIGKRQAEAMAREEFYRWNRHGRVVRAGEQIVLPQTGGMTPDSPPTFAQFAPDYLEWSASPNGPRGANSKQTLKNKRNSLRLHLLPIIGSMSMDKLTSRDVDRYVIQKTKEGRAEGTIARDLDTLRQMLRVALDYELIDKVPVIRGPRQSMGKIKALDPDEAECFRDKSRELFEPRRAVLLELYLRTGLRCGEALALTPADLTLDVERPTVHVTRSWGQDGFGPTKNGKPRIVPLVPSLAAKLDELLCERGLSPRSQTQHPFSAPHRTSRPLSGNRVLQLVKKVGEAAGTRALHTHMLRHTFGTECARRRVPLLTIKEWMGHTDVKVTMRYLHLVAPDHLRWADLLGE